MESSRSVIWALPVLWKTALSMIIEVAAHSTRTLLPRCFHFSAAPEFLSTGCRSLSTDIYSLAMVLLELTIGDFAYTPSDLLSCTVNGVVDTERVSEAYLSDGQFKSDVQFGKRPSIFSEVPARRDRKDK